MNPLPDSLEISRDGDTFRFRLLFPLPDVAPGVVVTMVEALTAFLEESGVSPANINQLGIAAEELLLNLAKYGDAGNAGLRADGAVTLGEKTITFRIADNSIPFDPRGREKPNLSDDPMERAIGGLGLFMLFEMFEECRYARTADGNVSEWILRRGEGGTE
jgi:serine/threonine-protein kinase RsbW